MCKPEIWNICQPSVPYHRVNTPSRDSKLSSNIPCVEIHFITTWEVLYTCIDSVRTTGELGGDRLPLIRHGLPWKRDLWNVGESQKILKMCYFDVQFQFCLMWSSWIIMCNIATKKTKIIHDGDLNLIHFNKDYYTCYSCHEHQGVGALWCKFHSCLGLLYSLVRLHVN